MSSENFSKSQFTFSKKEGQSELAFLINNSSNVPRHIHLEIKDGQSGQSLPATLNGVPFRVPLVVPAQTISRLLVNVAEANKIIIIEFQRNSSEGGMSLRQKNSSSNGVVTNIVELILK